MILNAVDETEALEVLHREGCTDGLPVIVPTPERVQRMVLASGLDGDLVLGEVGPQLGQASVEKVAINAVMAGCLPDHFPVVVAAVRAACDPVFDLTEVQSTTHGVAPLLLVNGPARDACGPIARAWGALGPGHRANASIGRALRLVLINIGGGRPGVSDMALLGHAGKFTSCLAEDEEASPFPPLHVALGFRPEQSVVTVAGVEAPHSVIGLLGESGPAAAARLVGLLGAAVANVGANNAHGPGGASVVVVLNPDHAEVLADAGYDRAAIQQGIASHACNRRDRLRALSALVPDGDGADLLPAVAGPECVLVLVAGGAGLYSVVFPSWGGGPHGNQPVSAEIELDQACEVPTPAPAAGPGASR